MITITKKYEELEAWASSGLAAGDYDLTIDATTMTDGDHKVGEKFRSIKASSGITLHVKFINVPSSFTNAGDMFKPGLFQSAYPLVSVDVSAFTNITNASYMFYSCATLTSITGLEAFTNVTNASYMFYDCSGLTSIDTKAFTKVTNATNMFRDCTGLTSVDTQYFTEVTNAYGMFYNCTGLTSVDTQYFTKVTDASSMFYGCTGLTSIDISPFNKATDATNMFYLCTSLKEINWGVIQPVTNDGMFNGTAVDKIIKVPSNADTGSIPTKSWINSNATAMSLNNYNFEEYTEIPVIPFDGLTNWMPYMLVGLNKITIDCSTMTNENHSIGEKLNTAATGALFDVKLINLPDDLTDATDMFNGCNKLISVDISSLAKIENASNMFSNCFSLASIDTQYFTNVTNASYMFYNCSDLKTIDTQYFTNVTNARAMFAYCTELTSIDISNFTETNNAGNMFINCTSLTDVAWGTIKPATNADMFSGASATKKILVSDQATADWIKTNETNMGLTNYSTNLVTDIPTVIPYEKLSLYAPAFKPGSYGIFIDCSTITNADHRIGEKLKLASEGADFQVMLINVPEDFTDANNMFSYCTKIISIDTSAFTNVTNAESMFHFCKGLTTIDTSSFKNVTDANNMFYDCSGLKSIDCSAFTNVTNADNMFGNCSILTSVTGTEAFKNVTNASMMFYYCSELTSIDISSFVNAKTNSMFQDCISLTGITWGNIRPATSGGMFSNDDPAAKVIKVAGQSAVDWLKANETKMHLTNYTTEFLPIPEPIPYEELTEYASRYTAEAHDITIDCSTITNEDHKIGEKLNLAPEGATFNVTLINVPDNFTNASYMFKSCNKLTSIDTSVFKNITDAGSMFKGCKKLTSIDTKAFAKVTSSSIMFMGCTGLTSIDCSFIKGSTSYMLKDCTSLTDITWGSIKPSYHTNMFEGASADKVIKVAGPAPADWIRTNETAMALTNYTIETLPIPDPIPYKELGTWAGAFLIGNHDITIDCSTITNEDHEIGSKLQRAAADVTFNVKLINVPEDFTNARLMFWDGYRMASIDVSPLKNITNASGMFQHCDLVSIDISALKNVENARGMFSICENLTSIDISALKNIKDAHGMFNLCKNLTSVSGLNVLKNVTDAGWMFKGCKKLTSIDTSAFTNVVDAGNIFFDCIGLTSIDCSAFKNVENAGGMFYNCSGLTSITGMEAFTKVKSCTQMFQDCSGLTSIDCSAFKNVENAFQMFRRCTGLIEIDIRNMKNIQKSDGMFGGCTSLVRITFGSNPPIDLDAYSGCPIKAAFVYAKDPTSVKNTVENSKSTSKWPTGVTWYTRGLSIFKFIRIA